MKIKVLSEIGFDRQKNSERTAQPAIRPHFHPNGWQAPRPCRSSFKIAMATEKQIEANRLNAQKSTGPKTGYPLGPRKANLHVVRLLAMALLVSCCAYCQCTLLNQSTCASVYSGSANPSLTTFLADVEGQYACSEALSDIASGIVLRLLSVYVVEPVYMRSTI